MDKRVLSKDEFNQFLRSNADQAWKKVYSITGGTGNVLTQEQQVEIDHVWRDFFILANSVKVNDSDLSEHNLPDEKLSTN